VTRHGPAPRRSPKKIDTAIGILGADVTAETTCLLTLRSASRVTRRAAHQKSRPAIPHEIPTMIDAIRTIARVRPHRCLAALLLCATLAACGGDGDSSAPPATNTPDATKPLMKCAP